MCLLYCDIPLQVMEYRNNKATAYRRMHCTVAETHFKIEHFVLCVCLRQNEVLPREVVAVLSQQRREELIRLRADDELRRQNQILFCFGDIKVRCFFKRNHFLQQPAV